MQVTRLASIALVVGLLGSPGSGTAASPDPSIAPVAPSPVGASVPGLVLAPGAPMGAEPPLREPVRPTGRVVGPDVERPADLDERLGPVRMQIWLPVGVGEPGDTLRFHVRISNLAKRTLRLYCPGFNLLTGIAELFPKVPAPTREDEFYRIMLGILRPGLLTVPIQQRAEDNPACAGKAVASRFPLGPGRTLEVTADALLVAPYGGQALPGGSLHVSSGVQWTPKGGAPGDGGALGLSGELTIEGPDWPWASPVELVDAIDAVLEVRALFDRPVGWDVLDVPVPDVLTRLPGWTLPASVDPSHLLAWRLVPEPADPDDGARPVTILVDPWTAQVIAVLPD